MLLTHYRAKFKTGLSRVTSGGEKSWICSNVLIFSGILRNLTNVPLQNIGKCLSLESDSFKNSSTEDGKPCSLSHLIGIHAGRVTPSQRQEKWRKVFFDSQWIKNRWTWIQWMNRTLKIISSSGQSFFSLSRNCSLRLKQVEKGSFIIIFTASLRVTYDFLFSFSLTATIQSTLRVIKMIGQPKVECK